VKEGPERGKQLISIARKRLVKTMQAGEDFVLAAMICEVWKLAMGL
jgi:hypothetical protein